MSKGSFWLFLFVAATVAFAVWRLSRTAAALLDSGDHASRGFRPGSIAPAANSAEPMDVIAFEDANGQRAVTISTLSSQDAFHQAQRMDLAPTLLGRLNAVMQSVPQAAVAEAHRGKNLMEVVIDGKLMRAADGDGFRAMTTKGTTQIKEHARLYETQKLGRLVNAAALWQVASVVVAQKHLADIAEQLAELSKSVQEIAGFLSRERTSVISGTHDYLQQAVQVLRSGELSASIRGELESCERELIGVQHHLLADIKAKLAEDVPHSDNFGTQELQRGLMAKYSKLQGLATELRACLKARVLAFYVLSLYPGELGAKGARLAAIQASSQDLDKLQERLKAEMLSDVARLDSWWNLQGTLVSRKMNVLDTAKRAQSLLRASGSVCVNGLAKTQALLEANDKPMTLLVEMDDDRIQEVRLAARPV